MLKPVPLRIVSALTCILLTATVAGAAEPRLEKVDLFEARTGGYFAYRIPGIVVSTQGTLLAYVEARKQSRSDWAEIDILLRRSTDGGKTWGERQTLASAAGKTVNNPLAIVDAETGAVHFLYCIEYARAFYMRSDDDGKTFTAPVEITATFEQFRQDYDWNVIATGPGHGIQLRNGRLVVPVWLSTGGKSHRPSIVATIYSDDHGATWQRGEVVVTHEQVRNPSETLTVELADGKVLLNIRNEAEESRRAISVSSDGAHGWSPSRFDPALYEPVCMAGLVRLTREGPYAKSRILFSNPDSRQVPKKEWSGSRENLMIKMSYDEAQTWPISKVLDAGIAGYSDLAAGGDKMIYCLYERGGVEGEMFDPRHVTLASFNVEWLTDGKDRLQPNK